MGTWRQVTIDGKTADAFEPAHAKEPAGAVLFLHGHGLLTLEGNRVYSAELERHGLRCLCPHGKRSWWGNRLCGEFDSELTPVDYLRSRVLPWMDENWHVKPPAIALVGVSMGGQGALRLAYRYPNEFPIVAALAPAVDFQNWHGRGLPLDEMYDTRESARQDTATLHLHPLNWPRHQLLFCDPADAEWFEGVERLASKLSSTGIPYDFDFKTTHGGHSWDYFDFMAPRVLEFVADALSREARRVE